MHTHQKCTRVPVSPHLCQHLLFCFIGSSHSGCEVIAVWIYLIISDAEHLLMCLLAICISLLEKRLLLCPFFLNWIFFFQLLIYSPSFSLINRPLIHDLWIFSFILQDPFSCCWVFLLLCRKFLSLMRFNSSIFFFCGLYFCCHSQEIIAKSTVMMLFLYVFF